MSETERRPVALVTGGSRGVGAAAALALAARGYDVALTYRNKARRANGVVAEIERRGGRALALGGDMTNAADRDELVAALGAWRGRLDALILNASGGLERAALAADPNYPMVINRDAQVALLESALPLLMDGGAVVLVTSHWAHLYGRVAQIPAYEPIAASKHAGELALLTRQDALAARGIKLIIVTADVIEGTITPRLLERATPGLERQWSASPAPLPTAADVGEAIARAVTDTSLPSGHVVVIGTALDALLDQEEGNSA